MLENSNYAMQLITPQEAWSIRQPVLREGKPIDSCIFEGDDFDTTFHVGLFIDNNLVGVATFMKNSNALFLEKNQFQLRGMAVLETFQGRGIGHHILEYGESLLIKQDTKLVWCNAREIAVPFYQKNNYSIQGNSFVIPQIGFHYVMRKIL